MKAKANLLWVCFSTFFLFSSQIGFGGRPLKRPSLFKPARSYVFKKIGDVQLKLYVFLPPQDFPRPTPACIFFFGGGWVGGRPVQFYPFCAYFSSRGIVSVSAEYRVRKRHGVTPYVCVRDGKSAVRWLRRHAKELGIDPGRIAAGGGSAGGHVAGCCGVIKGGEEKGEDLGISSKPNALVLFNPVLATAPIEGASADLSAKIRALASRLKGGDPKAISPFHHISPDDPPTIIFHGTADRVVPFEEAELFCDAMRKAGVRCELVPYKGCLLYTSPSPRD